MLGGRDFERLIVDNIVRPWLLRTFNLPENCRRAGQGIALRAQR
jgi:molecular chaperone DnaK